MQLYDYFNQTMATTLVMSVKVKYSIKFNNPKTCRNQNYNCVSSTLTPSRLL